MKVYSHTPVVFKKITTTPVLIGVSFGGIIVQEMSRIISCKKVVIISSVKSYKEFPIHILLGRKSKAYKYFPTQWVDKTEILLVLFLVQHCARE